MHEPFWWWRPLVVLAAASFFVYLRVKALAAHRKGPFSGPEKDR